MTAMATFRPKLTFLVSTHSFRAPGSIRRYRNLCGSNVLRTQPQATSRRYVIRSELVNLPNGTNMEVLHVQSNQVSLNLPSAEKPPLVFVHGSFHAAWCFQLFQSFFASHGFDSFAVSLRGAGNTDAPQASNPTVEDHVSDLSALLSHLNLPLPPIVVGHSLGGFIVQKWAEQDSLALISAIVLMSSTPPSGNSKLVRRIMLRDGFWKTIRITLGFIRRSLTTDLPLCREMFFSPKTATWFSQDLEGDDRLREYMELFKGTTKTLDVKSLKNVVKHTGHLRGKAFVVGGSADSLVDMTALEETARFWEGDLVILEDAPHDVMLYSKWEEAAGQVLRWVKNKAPSYENQGSIPEKL